VRRLLPQSVHISRRRGIYCYRRRVPGDRCAEVAISLRTRHFREAEHRAGLLDGAFDDALRRARETMSEGYDVNAILREYLRAALDVDLHQRLHRRPGRPVYRGDGGLQWTPQEVDLETVSFLLNDALDALGSGDTRSVARQAEALMVEHGLPEEARQRLALGLLEANVALLKEMRRRTVGEAALVLDTTAAPPSGDATPPTKPAAPLASMLLPVFSAWGRESAGWRANAERQAEASLRLFLDVAGDKAVDAYSRVDGDAFRTALRRLPRNYRKSGRDADRSVAELIAQADTMNAPRLSEKTIKRHFWAVSRFFAFLMETGQLPRDFDNPGRGFSFNTKGSARSKRDMWTGDELRRLFQSPVWTGCQSHRRSQRGSEIIRDALFWLPLLGLFHGNRLEEFAQLRGGDVLQAEGVWFLNITDDGGRQLKNQQSRRRVPLHSELIRVGFLDYATATAPRPHDSLFPYLKPGGADKKLGYGFSKQFSHYRKAIGLRRPGLDYHSFRHGVTTKLYEANINEGWIDLLTGHEDGSESRRRYLKSVGLSLLQSAIECVKWPEVDLSRLYRHTEGQYAASR
jgi:site-specific recombinase XerD